MSTDVKSVRKKRNSPGENPSAPAPEGDHRKRRRNRTTQSCLNCHTSKRMCDRKRPCGRCTQLGLTGLCVYEVDDPSQRNDGQDESSQLRKRVAELEGVIRELKNKPHPRWIQSSSTPSEEFEKWHARAQLHPKSGGSSTESHEKSDATKEASKSNSNEEFSSKESAGDPSQQDYCSAFPRSSLPTPALTFDLPSPLSSPQSVIMTPTDEYSHSYSTITNDHQAPGDLEFASMFISYPGLMGCSDSLAQVDRVLRGDSLNDTPHESCLAKQSNIRTSDGHCGCLYEATNYTAILELSLRLRKAADVLSRSSNHRLTSRVCVLSQRITDLDHFAKITLTSMPTTPNESLHSGTSANLATHSAVAPFSVNSCLPAPVPSSTISPQSLHGLRPWDIISSVSDPSCDDSFMSWEPPRRG
ncbi:hypothetical protein V8B97DRAFT_2075161 [Scleroderma yunnanense]